MISMGYENLGLSSYFVNRILAKAPNCRNFLSLEPSSPAPEANEDLAKATFYTETAKVKNAPASGVGWSALLDEAATRQKKNEKIVYNSNTCPISGIFKKEYTMNPTEAKRFNEFYQRHLRLLKLQGKSQKTIDAYSRAVRRVSEHFDCCPDQLTPEQLEIYFARLVVNMASDFLGA